MAQASLRGHAAQALASRRIARFRCPRDQRLVLHADQAGDLPALVRRDATGVSVRTQRPPLRDALQTAARLREVDRVAARSGGAAAREAPGGPVAAAQ